MVSVLTLIIGVIGIINMNNLNTQYRDLYDDYGKSQGVLGQLGIAFEGTRSSMKSIFIEQNDLATRQAEADKLRALTRPLTNNLRFSGKPSIRLTAKNLSTS